MGDGLTHVLSEDLNPIGRPVQAMIAIRVRPPSRRNIEGFRNWVAELPDTLGVYVTAGSDDFLVHVAVADNTSLYSFVIDKLTERPEVADVRTSIVYEHLRNTRMTPTNRSASVPPSDVRRAGLSATGT